MTRPADKVSAVPAGTWTIDPMRSRIRFEVSHFRLQVVEGIFPVAEGVIVTDTDTSLSSVVASVEIASVDSGMASRDNAIRSAKLFNAAEHPRATYRSHGVRSVDQGLLVDGTVDLLAAPRPLTCVVHVVDAGIDTLALTAKAEVSRHEMGVQFRGKPAFLDRAIGDQVKLSIHIAATTARPADG